MPNDGSIGVVASRGNVCVRVVGESGTEIELVLTPRVAREISQSLAKKADVAERQMPTLPA